MLLYRRENIDPRGFNAMTFSEDYSTKGNIIAWKETQTFKYSSTSTDAFPLQIHPSFTRLEENPFENKG